MAQKKMKKSKSLCEESMKLMMNIIKLSSLSLTALNLSPKNEANRPFGSSNSQLVDMNSRSQAQASKYKMQTYLMEQDAGDTSHSSIYEDHRHHLDDHTFSDYIEKFHKRNEHEIVREATNSKVSSYIKRFHQTNSCDHTLAASTGFPSILPPPPPPPRLKK